MNDRQTGWYEVTGSGKLHLFRTEETVSRCARKNVRQLLSGVVQTRPDPDARCGICLTRAIADNERVISCELS
jgi:hypothetical protein